MNILACVKRVPATGAKIVLTDDERAIDARHLGFTVSPHEECGVEEGIRLKEAHGGTVTVLTLGPEESIEQLRFSIAQGADRAILLQTDGSDWDPVATANALVNAIKADQAENGDYDVLIFGNESADSGGYQVGVRVANALDVPCVTGVKALSVEGGVATAKKDISGGWEVYEVSTPAVFTVKEGINLPRYPSLPGRLRAKKAKIPQNEQTQTSGGLDMTRLRVPTEQHAGAEILGEGPDAAIKVVEILKQVGVISA